LHRVSLKLQIEKKKLQIVLNNLQLSSLKYIYHIIYFAAIATQYIDSISCTAVAV
jgi:hypothetical protein